MGLNLKCYKELCLRNNTLSDILWILVIFYSFTGFNLKIAAFPFESYLFLLIIVYACFLLVGKGLADWKKWRLTGIIILSIAAINAISAFVNPGTNSLIAMLFDGSVRILGYLLVAIALGGDGFTGHERFKKRISWLVVAALMQCILSFAFYIFAWGNPLNAFISPVIFDNKVVSYRLTGLLGDAGAFSTYLLIAFFASMYLFTDRIKALCGSSSFIRTVTDKKVLLFFLASVVELIAMILTQSYSAVAIAVLCTLIYALLSIRMEKKYILLVVLAAVVFIVLIPGLLELFVYENKKSFWANYAGLDVAFERPWFGIGTGNYAELVINPARGLYHLTPFGMTTTVPYCTYILSFAENGIFSALAWGMLILSIFFTGIKNLITSRKPDQDQKADISPSIFVFTIILAILIRTFSYDVLHAPVIMMVFLSMALPYRIRRETTDVSIQKQYKIVKWVAFSTSVLLAGGIAFAGVKFANADNYNDKKMEETRLSYVQEIEDMHKTIKTNLGKVYESNGIDKETYTTYSATLESFRGVVNDFIEPVHSKAFNSRPFKDLFSFYKNLYYMSESFTKANMKICFEVTLPVQIFNYSSDNVVLPYYGYTVHEFPEITDLPLVYYVNKGFYLNPIHAIRGIDTKYLDNGRYDEFKSAFKELAELMETKSYNGKEFLTPIYCFEFNKYLPPWSSGMAEGVLLDVTSKAYKLTGDEYYYEFAQKLLPAFSIDYKDGGVMYADKEYGLPFLLEYTYGEKERELNGCIIGAVGLRSWYRVSGDKKALEIYRNIIQDVIYRLKDYNYPMDDLPEGASWSKYSLVVYPVQKNYQRLHLNLLSSLSRDELIMDLDGFEDISFYLDRWTKAYRFRYPDEDIQCLFESDLDKYFK